MSSKYGDRIDDDKWAPDGSKGQLQITTHARQRWAERTPAGTPSLDEALAGAIPVHEGVLGAFQSGEHGDTLREALLIRTHGHDRSVDVILLVSAEWEPPAVVTCFSVGSEYDRSLRAYCRARLDCYPEQPEERADE